MSANPNRWYFFDNSAADKVYEYKQLPAYNNEVLSVEFKTKPDNAAFQFRYAPCAAGTEKTYTVTFTVKVINEAEGDKYAGVKVVGSNVQKVDGEGGVKNYTCTFTSTTAVNGNVFFIELIPGNYSANTRIEISNIVFTEVTE